jgi:hypothetical protein
MDKNEPFPLDWNHWRALWNDWKSEHAAGLRRTSYRFHGKNFMADEILGTWAINGRNVELSEVTFIDTRSVGITFGTAAGTDVPDNPIVYTFAELEKELGLEVGQP